MLGQSMYYTVLNRVLLTCRLVAGLVNHRLVRLSNWLGSKLKLFMPLGFATGGFVKASSVSKHFDFLSCSVHRNFSCSAELTNKRRNNPLGVSTVRRPTYNNRDRLTIHSFWNFFIFKWQVWRPYFRYEGHKNDTPTIEFRFGSKTITKKVCNCLPL